jgi:hypothetical protein
MNQVLGGRIEGMIDQELLIFGREWVALSR